MDDASSWYDWQWLPVAVVSCVVYLTYYLTMVVRKPVLLSSDGDYRDRLLENIGVLNQNFWPTFWCFTGKMQTVFRVIMKSKPELDYQTELLELPDGGIVRLDWLHNRQDRRFKEENRPTLILLPGITGCCNASYSRHFMLAALDSGYRGVVFNNRGIGENITLKTPKTFSACYTEDLEHVLENITARYNNSPVFCLGVSLGGMILTNYLAASGKKVVPQLAGAFVVSVPWNSSLSTSSLEEPLNWFLFNRFITTKLLNMLKRNLQLFQNSATELSVQLDHVLQAKTIREFDDRFTSRVFGYKGYADYYQAASIHTKPLHDVAVPLMFLNAADDPFSPGHGIPHEKIAQNPKVAAVITAYGGHIGFIEGLLGRGRSLPDHLMMQFADFVLTGKANS